MQIKEDKDYMLTEDLTFDYDEEIGPDDVRGHWRVYLRGRHLMDLSAILPLRYNRQPTLDGLLMREFSKRFDAARWFKVPKSIRLEDLSVRGNVISVKFRIPGKAAHQMLTGWMPEAKLELAKQPNDL